VRVARVGESPRVGESLRVVSVLVDSAEQPEAARYRSWGWGPTTIKV
jgi:hypothetical protein